MASQREIQRCVLVKCQATKNLLNSFGAPWQRYYKSPELCWRNEHHSVLMVVENTIENIAPDSLTGLRFGELEDLVAFMFTISFSEPSYPVDEDILKEITPIRIDMFHHRGKGDQSEELVLICSDPAL